MTTVQGPNVIVYNFIECIQTISATSTIETINYKIFKNF